MTALKQTIHGPPAHSYRPRVLIEDPDPALEVSDFSMFRDAGFDVVVCSGPGAAPCECVLLRRGSCDLVDQCDVLVFGLPASTLGSASVLWAVHRARPDLPILLRDPVDEQVPSGCVPLPRTTSVVGQLRAIRAAASRDPRSVRA